MFEQMKACAGSLAGSQFGLAQSSGALQEMLAQQSSAPTPAPLTLARAISLTDDLNKRLGSLSSAIGQIASTIGGPFPTGANVSTDQPPSSSVVAALNEKIDCAHGWVSDMENAVAAVRRSLGS